MIHSVSNLTEVLDSVVYEMNRIIQDKDGLEEHRNKIKKHLIIGLKRQLKSVSRKTT